MATSAQRRESGPNTGARASDSTPTANGPKPTPMRLDENIRMAPANALAWGPTKPCTAASNTPANTPAASIATTAEANAQRQSGAR